MARMRRTSEELALCRANGISTQRFWSRVRKGWTQIDAASTPPLGSGKQRLPNARYIEYNGIVDSIAGWGRRIGISRVSLLKRLRKYPLDVALKPGRSFGGSETLDGHEPSKRKSLLEPSCRNGVTPDVARQRLYLGWPKEDAFTIPTGSRRGNRWGQSTNNKRIRSDLAALGMIV